MQVWGLKGISYKVKFHRSYFATFWDKIANTKRSKSGTGTWQGLCYTEETAPCLQYIQSSSQFPANQKAIPYWPSVNSDRVEAPLRAKDSPPPVYRDHLWKRDPLKPHNTRLGRPIMPSWGTFSAVRTLRSIGALKGGMMNRILNKGRRRVMCLQVQWGGTRKLGPDQLSVRDIRIDNSN